MGTPDFAVPCLEALNTNGYDVILVITQPDRPKGRDRKVTPPPVKTAALRLGYEVIQPLSIGANDFIAHLAGLKSDIFVVVAFGHIL
ncbi:MAG: methionyl-tRNA formyltransferase, partial [Deltaproteobacteria bacterium]|nr:methionyl-tRNA formyltransferase [Deltaproteobacteria bacterium]